MTTSATKINRHQLVIIFVLLFPLILAAEWLLIDRGILAKVVNIVMRIMHWGIIGIHRLDNGARDEDAMDELGEGAPVEPAMVSEIREGRLGRC